MSDAIGTKQSMIDKILGDAEMELDESLIKEQKRKYKTKLKELKNAELLVRNVVRELEYIKQEIKDELGLS